MFYTHYNSQKKNLSLIVFHTSSPSFIASLMVYSCHIYYKMAYGCSSPAYIMLPIQLLFFLLDLIKNCSIIQSYFSMVKYNLLKEII